MEYVSTRGSVPAILSQRAIIQGLAEDGGLYVPSSFPPLGPDPFNGPAMNSYAAKAVKILQAFLPDYSVNELTSACRAAYADSFDDPAIAPVKFFPDGTAVLELWHGPTQAFKDMALQLMPRLLSSALKSEGEKYELVILVATSGDTGKAALEGFANAAGVRLFVFYPHEGVSAIQRLQMVTQRGLNVGAWAVRGNFDDTQTGVKQIFTDPVIKKKLASFGFQLSSANSINWGRLAPQIAYYFTGYDDLVTAGKIRRGQPIVICVPTGNFGNILAAYYAIKCGLPVSRLLCASNKNKVLTDFIHTGVYDRRREFFKTASPSMDILISSNLERLLFELAERQAVRVSQWMSNLASGGWYSIAAEESRRLKSLFYGGFADHLQTLKAIKDGFEKQDYLMDPHTAVGYRVLRKYQEETGDNTPALLASTANPFKFNRAVLEALGVESSGKDEFVLLEELARISHRPIPAKLAELKSLPEVHTGVGERERMVEVLYQFLGINAGGA